MKESAPTILKEILSRKEQEIEALLSEQSLATLEAQAASAAPPRGFVEAIEASIATGSAAVIAEIKKASPSKGVMRENFNVAEIATSYEKGGATCLSVLTDRDFFQGCNENLIIAKEHCSLPVIRKDFIIHRAQIAEARAIGADCILLIAAALDDKSLASLNSYAQDLDLDVLIEVHNADELTSTLKLSNRLIGINNRNLHTFETTLDTTFSLLERMDGPERIVVTESGIHTRQDVDAMRARSVDSFLVGEAFMRASDPGAELQKLFS